MTSSMNTKITTPLLFTLPIQARELREFLPQRYPMMMVDRVTELVPGDSISGIKNVTCNEEYFQGHFPQQPMMPGVLMLEAMAQLAGVLGYVTVGKRPRDGLLFVFAGADKLRFRRPVLPGDALQLQARLLTVKCGIYKFACNARVDGQLVTSVDILVAEQQLDFNPAGP